MLADTDAGNVVTAADAGARFGYRLLPLTLLLAPALYLMQELTLRLGVATGRGHAELIRERYGLPWAVVAVAGLAVAAIGSLVTEFTGVAGVGEMFGLPRCVRCRLPPQRSSRLSRRRLSPDRARGAHHRPLRTRLLRRRVESPARFRDHREPRRQRAHPRPPVSSAGAGIIGATFNPWMVFYQQSATVDKGLGLEDLSHARADTGVGAALTQCLTGAVLVATAAVLGSQGGAGASRA